jgi:hypothetical protein
MLRYRVSGISEQLAQTVRSTLQSPQYGHPAHVEVASGYGPCRQCLKTFNQGQEERILHLSALRLAWRVTRAGARVHPSRSLPTI